MAKTQGLNGFRPKLISIAVASCFVTGTALANPTAPTVVYGSAAFQQSGNLLKVTNSPSAIINWQSFSIGAGEITRFIQQSQSSSVLNRVTGSAGAIDPSVILGALQSNGRVYLINPSGIVFGAGAQVDVAGLVASSLNLSNADFLANRLNFTESQGAGAVVNQGNINTSSGGNVYLVGSAVTNSGIITSPQGQVVLAAGNSVELVDPGTPNLRVEITAPDNLAVNLGQVVADAGRIGIYAGLINNSGTLRASSAVAEGGRILLKATKQVTLESTSILDASGNGGGTIEVLSKNGGTVKVAGRLDASAPTSGNGGFIDTSADTFIIADDTVVTTAAPNGKTGNWLIDPTNIWIAVDQTTAYGAGMIGTDTSADLSAFYGSNPVVASGAVSDSFLSTGNLQTALASTSITVSTANAAAYGSGYITVVSPVSWSSNNSLTLLANSNLTVNAPVSTTGSGNISMYAGWNGASTTTPVVPVGCCSSIYLNGAVSTSGDVILVAGNGISQTASAPIAANRLLADGGEGGVFLDLVNNMVNTLAGRAAIDVSPGCCASGGFHFNNGQALTIGSVPKPSGAVSGITTNNGEVVVNAVGGTLTVSQPISATMRPGSFAASVSLNGDTGVTITSAVSAIGGNNTNVYTFAGNVDGNDANVTINSGGSININGGSVTATGGNAGTANTAYGGDVFAAGGNAQVWLSAGNGIVVSGSVSAIAGNGGTAITNSGYAYAYGGYSSTYLYGGAGGITGSGNVGAMGGLGGTATAGGLAASSANGGDAYINISGAGQITLGGTIGATGRAGGSASGGDSAEAVGGPASLHVSSSTGVTFNGAVNVTGGAGGTASATTSHYADGGSGYIDVNTPGPVTIGAMTATGGAGGPGGSPRVGGYAGITIDGAEGSPSGPIQISGTLTANGGNGIGGAQGGDAYVVMIGSSVNVGAAISATGGNGTPMGVAEVDIASLGDVTLGGNITTSGGVFVDQQTFDVFGGIYIQAGLGGAGAIISNGGVLSAVRAEGAGEFPVIELLAANGIGTVAQPVRILDGSEATGPDIHAINSGATGDIAISAVASDVTLQGDLQELHNSNPNGIYLIQTEAAGKNLQFDIPFMPGGAPLMAGQSVFLGALQADLIIGPSASIATSGAGYASLVAGGSISSTGSITGLVNANALGGTITLSQAPGFTLGLMQATGNVSINSTGGAIVDGNGGAMNVIAPSAGLFGAAGAGSLADPLETQIGTLSGSATGTFGVVNSGNLAINGFTFSGSDAAIGTTGTLSLMTPISATAGNLYLAANNGMQIQYGVTVGGDLSLNSGTGDLGIAGADVTANNIALAGNNIFIGFQSSTAPTNVVATGLVSGVSAGNFNVLAGANSGANALLEGMNVDLVVGTTAGFLNIADLGNGATARIHSVSPTTITVNFPNLGAGGYFVNGVEGAITNGNTGFFAGAAPAVPAVLNQNLIVTYGGVAPPPPPPPNEPPAEVEEVVNQVVASTNEQTDNKPAVTTTDPKEGEGEKDKKGLPTCK